MSLSAGAAVGIGAAVTAASTGTQVAMNTKLNKKNRQWQDQVRLQQRRWNLEDWERETAYNDPSAVLKRYQNAGINKTFALTQGQSVQAPSTKSTDTPSAEQHAQRVDSPANVADMLNATALTSQINKTDAETGHIKSQTALTDLKAVTERYVANEQAYNAAIAANDYELAKELYGMKVEYQGLLNASIKAQTADTLRSIGMKDEQIKSMQQDRDYQKKNFDQQVWRDIQNNKRGWFDSYTGRQNANTATNRLNLESPWFGYNKRPWYLNPFEEYKGGDNGAPDFSIKSGVEYLKDQYGPGWLEKLKDELSNMLKSDYWPGGKQWPYKK